MKIKMASVAVLMFSSAAYADGQTNHAGSLNWGQNISGYFDVHGGSDFGFDDFFLFGTPGGSVEWQQDDIGGAARVAAQLSARFSVQGDIWANDFGTTQRNTYFGAAVHATFDPTGHDQIGPFASIGGEHMRDFVQHSLTRLDMTNIGLEWAHNADHWRLYGQVGYSSNIDDMAFIEGWDPQWREIPFDNTYAALVGTYYFTPNLALSAKFAVDKYETSGVNWVVNNYELHWGAKLEYKPESLPIIGYVAYEGRHESFDDKGKIPADDGFSGDGVETVVMAGIRLAIGQGTIQGLYEHAGLADLNPAFGDFSY
jgi:hypothetical protein